MPKISVIVPVYKVEPYICRCVDSILSQTYSDFELILVDDGSPDGSGSICDEYAARNSRISIIHKSNAGVSTARNKGVQLVIGDYVTFIDSDDWISTYYLSKMASEAIEHKAQMVICGIYMDAQPEQPDALGKDEIDALVMTNRESITKYASDNLANISPVYRSPCCKLIRTTIVKAVPFPADRSYAEDAACVYLWMWKSNVIVSISDQLYFYYANPDSACHAEMKMNVIGNFQTESEWIDFYKHNGFDNLIAPTINRYLNDCIWAYNGLSKSSHPENAVKMRKLCRRAIVKYYPTIRKNMGLYRVGLNFAFPQMLMIRNHLVAALRMLKHNGIGAVLKRLRTKKGD